MNPFADGTYFSISVVAVHPRRKLYVCNYSRPQQLFYNLSVVRIAQSLIASL
jgi:hypothetical protein